MFTSRDLKAVITEVRPIVERQLDDAVLVAAFRETVTTKGGDWSQVKALVKAMIQDERDEAGGHKRVLAILHKAGNALGYADMLGLGNLNEKNSFADHSSDLRNMVPHDEDGVVIEAEEINLKAPASKAVEAVTTPEEITEPEAAMLPQTGAVEALVANSQSVQATASPGNDGLVTSSAGTEGEADRQPIRPDYTKPNPICADPDDCGIEASWHHTCSTCLRRRDAQRHQAEAVH